MIYGNDASTGSNTSSQLANASSIISREGLHTPVAWSVMLIVWLMFSCLLTILLWFAITSASRDVARLNLANSAISITELLKTLTDHHEASRPSSGHHWMEVMSACKP